MNGVEIMEYDPLYQRKFRTLNMVWIEKYFWVEDIDLMILDNPQEKILDNGGMVLFAKMGNAIVGTGAIINHGNGIFELSKMAVDHACQGKGIGERIISSALKWMKDRNGKEVFLETHPVLERAINLYKKMGFSTAKDGPSDFHYERTSLKMKLAL
ncbi:MAG: GNAT family N-acetyltransferase [Thermodesulfobacteriota bacterium]|nr:GNAT family N-acetyltransferase [Thermodesulfobacteriota bacterium]